MRRVIGVALYTLVAARYLYALHIGVPALIVGLMGAGTAADGILFAMIGNRAVKQFHN